MRLLKTILFVFFCISTTYAASRHCDRTYNVDQFLYTGPLITTSATNIAPKHVCVQPYLFMLNNYGEYNSTWQFQAVPSSLSINPSLFLQTGITNWLDFSGWFSFLYNDESGHNAFKYGDTLMIFGIQIATETKHCPAIRITVKESLPTGKFENLNPEKLGIDAGGNGSYQTTIAWNMSKIFHWLKKHPINARISLGYMIPTSVHVKGFNAYGGGFGADGKVRPGKLFTGAAAFEYSFTYKFAYAMDLIYTYGTATKFSGNPGETGDGSVATVGSGITTQFSVTPSLEYNFNKHWGIIAGMWASVTGKNSTEFIGGAISLVATY